MSEVMNDNLDEEKQLKSPDNKIRSQQGLIQSGEVTQTRGQDPNSPGDDRNRDGTSAKIPTSNGITIYFKIRNRIKKAIFTGSTLDDLKDLFFKKFQDESENEFGFTKETLPPLLIENKQLKLKFELEDVADLYEDAVVEILTQRESVPTAQYAQEQSTMATILRNLGHVNRKLVIVMVGLPARGKTYLARKISRYLNWLGVSTRVFNVGQYRRARLGAQQPHNFFAPSNEEGEKKRLHLAIAALDDMIEWLVSDGHVGIYDATNTTKARRKLILARCSQENLEIVFLESICNDDAIIENNIKETKLNSPDYQGVDPVKAVADFRERIKHYEARYETIDEEHLSYIKLIDIGKKVIINNINSYLSSRIVFFLMNLHNTPKSIYLTRHGQSEFNLTGRIGGDSELTTLGDEYAHLFSEWVQKNTQVESGKLTIFTSTLKRTIQTTQYIPSRKIRLKSLDEIDAGEFDGMTYDEIAKKFPEEYAARAKDKLRYRYPRGESYLDVIARLEPVIFELERQKQDVVVVSHQAVLRCLYAYFADLPLEECPYINIPLHTIIKLVPKTYGCDIEKIRLMDTRVGDSDT